MRAIQRLQGMIEYGFRGLDEDESINMGKDADALMLEIEQADECIEQQAAEIKRLEEALENISIWVEPDYKMKIDVLATIVDAVREIAEQALKGGNDGT